MDYIQNLISVLPHEVQRKKRFIPVLNKKPLRSAWNDPTYWLTLSNIADRYSWDSFRVAYVTDSTDDLRILDLDHVIVDGGFVSDIKAELSEILALSCYTECSVSCSGLHILSRPMYGALPKKPKLRDDTPWGIEIFGQQSGVSCVMLTGYVRCSDFCICENVRLGEIVQDIVNKFSIKKNIVYGDNKKVSTASKPKAFYKAVLHKQLDAARERIVNASVGNRDLTLLQTARLLGGYYAGGVSLVAGKRYIKSQLLKYAELSGFTRSHKKSFVCDVIDRGFNHGLTEPIGL